MPIKIADKHYQELEVTGMDRVLLQAIADSKYNVGAITNKSLRETLKNSPWANSLEDKPLSARISRQLRLLREHGIIRKNSLISISICLLKKSVY